MGLFSNHSRPAQSYALFSNIPERKAVITVSFVRYEWWLLRWGSSDVICQVFVEHEDWPDYSEVKHYCGEKVARDWHETDPCQFSDHQSDYIVGRQITKQVIYPFIL